MKEYLRYTGDPKRLYDFMDEFIVHCPKCYGQAEVKVPFFLDSKNAKLTCKACHFSEKMNNRLRFILSGKAKCQFCLEFLDLQIEGKKQISKYVNIKCSHCQAINKVSENWSETYLKYPNEGIVDPAFGLSLWYQDAVKGDIIWAYNLSHLIEIKNYIQSSLRERTTDKFKMTMVEKLPGFIKMAKNRDEVLKALQRMLGK